MRNFKVTVVSRYGVTTGILFLMERAYNSPEISVAISKKDDDGKWHVPMTSIGYSEYLVREKLETFIKELEIAKRLMELLTLHCSGWPNINCRNVHWLYTDENFENSLLNMFVIS